VLGERIYEDTCDEKARHFIFAFFMPLRADDGALLFVVYLLIFIIMLFSYYVT